jgi:hypothetical protein
MKQFGLHGHLVHEPLLHRKESVFVEADFSYTFHMPARNFSYVHCQGNTISSSWFHNSHINYSAYSTERFQDGFLFTNVLELQLQANTVNHVVTLISFGAVNCCVIYTQTQSFRSYS